ncbi:MAG: hypothetical protein HQL05_05960 [Nitrospirae bacterium]|uniref:hypothetical protein n=1 Tax=Candidatus Magnetobacterium casense TaxID=1455061 RepID=UPI0012DC072B|nr:hypothetical protein [Candidatus Magnetobacterium casensis]MBF0337359.1 hypothetical protein [Nitrospirota bacterium]
MFDTDNVEHHEFEPVFEWITRGKGKIVYGGSTYAKELEEMKTRRNVLKSFDKARKIVYINDVTVDDKEEEYKAHVNNRDFDDPHIVAIIAVSGVKLVCTNDDRSIPFLKNKKFYPKGKSPKIYTSKKNANLLCDNNIAKCCKPANRLNKTMWELLTK